MARNLLVSCILRGRLSASAASQTIGSLLRQDYKAVELILIDDSNQSVDFVSPDPRVRYVQLGSRLSPAELRNFACRQARGDIMVDCGEHWWYAPHHISLLTDPLVHSGVQVAAPESLRFCDFEGRAWEVRWKGTKRSSIPAGCVAWRRSWWERNPFGSEPDSEVITFDRARIARVAGPVSAVCFRPPPRELARTAYDPDDLRAILGRDAKSYGLAEAHPPAVAQAAQESSRALTKDPPLVSCILVAHDSAAAAIAVDLFRAQEYEPKELILVDRSGTLADLLPRDSRYRYVGTGPETSMGEARNLGCAESAGELIAHWEENDWHLPRRLPALVSALLSEACDLCGESSTLLCDLDASEAANLHYPQHAGFHVDGRSLLYRRSLWEQHRFPDTDFREDLSFVRRAETAKRRAVSETGLRVTFVPIPESPYAHPFPLHEVRRIVGADWSFFERERPLKATPAGRKRQEDASEVVRQASAIVEQQIGTVAARSSTSQVVPPPDPTTLVTCIMPTRDRPEFVRWAVEYFLRQDYPARELVVIDDGSEAIDHLLPPDPRLRYIRLAERLTIGAKRNLACQQARGDIIAHWDDDDWQSPARIRAQVETLEHENADVCGLGSILVVDAQAGRAWRYRCPITESSFYAVGTSLCYRRTFWERNYFANVDVAEDRQFLWNAGQVRMAQVSDESLVVAVLHECNTTTFNPGGAYWSAAGTEEVKAILRDDWQRYSGGKSMLVADRVSKSAPPPRADARQTLAPRPLHVESNGHRPLVSCIMPTHNRRRFIPLAIQMFLRQDYDPKEMVILDDGTDRVEDLVPQDDRFRYIRTAGEMSVGAKRNLGCAMARGEILLHWDDDDWQGSGRIRTMASALLDEKADLCGLNPLYFYDLRSGLAWLYRHPPEVRFWVAGTSMCYRREFWERNRFPDVDVGEDNHFIWNAAGGKMLALSDTNLQVALLHAENGSPKTIGDEYWQAHPESDIRWLMGADFHFYRFEPPLPRLNLGCADALIPGMWNVDRAGHPDQIADLRFAWPWADSSVEYIRAHDIIEHLPDRVHTMNEAWRILQPYGRIEIAVPTTAGSGAFQDPTHVSFWNRRTFLYFEAGNPYRERFAEGYGISAAFRVVFESAQDSIDGERLTIVLEAVK
jgi:glycosyltransferase involved in cell wall biosynthesis